MGAIVNRCVRGGKMMLAAPLCVFTALVVLNTFYNEYSLYV